MIGMWFQPVSKAFYYWFPETILLLSGDRFGQRTQPYLSVEYPWNYGKAEQKTRWATLDAFSGWSWNGYEGKNVIIHVFGTGNRYELYLNGKKVREGSLVRYRGKTELIYEPGELTVKTFQDNIETGQETLVTADKDTRLCLTAEKEKISSNGEELCYLEVSFRDRNGRINPMKNEYVSIRVEGSGQLEGMGSADPKSTDDFREGRYRTCDGRLVAVIRPKGNGEIHIYVSAEDGQKSQYVQSGNFYGWLNREPLM